MTPNLYANCILIALLGMAFHVFAIKLPALKERSRVANKPFHIKEYLRDDWIALTASLIAIIISVLIVDELLKWKPATINYIKGIFVFVGYTGSSVLQALLSKANKRINKVVDFKTNELDSIKGK